jgi:hypothetical protein
MPELSSIYPTRPDSTDASIAEPMPEHPYRDIFSAAAQNELVAGIDNLVAEPAAREQAYDARIKAIRDQTGIELENPERGGYSIEARRAIRQAVIAGGMSPIDETGGIPAYQKRIFDQKLDEVRQKHPDLNLPTDTAESIAHASGDTLSRAMDQPDLNPVLKYGAQFAGSLYGERRNPLFLGSLVAGPASSTSELALARIAQSALYQGLYNIGIAQTGKVATQKWQAQIGRDEGRMLSPAEIGASFLMGAIPGAGIEGARELAGPLRRLLSGRAEAGDMAKASEALGPVQSSAAAAMRAGEESLAADGAALAGGPSRIEPPAEGFTRFYHGGEDPTSGGPRWLTPDEDYARNFRAGPGGNEVHYVDIPTDSPMLGKSFDDTGTSQVAPFVSFEAPEEIAKNLRPLPIGEGLHDDLIGAALKRADDPTAPSPEATAAVDRPAAGELQDRIEQAAPQTPADAMRAADEALDDFGRRDGMAALRERMQDARAVQDEATETWRASEDRQQRARSDVLNKIPMVRRDGTVSMVAERTVRSMGDIEQVAADLVRSCK